MTNVDSRRGLLSASGFCARNRLLAEKESRQPDSSSSSSWVISPPEYIPPCAGCGRCCHLVVALRDGDRVPEAWVVEHDGERCMDQRGDGACVALDPVTFLCTIYEDRPQTCRDFHRGESLCRRVLGLS